MATADFNQARDLAIKYGDKKVIGRMAAMGMVEPTTAVLAGMMLDRIVANAIEPPETTVTEDVFAPPQAGLGAIAPQGMGQPQMAQAPQQGLDQIPVPEQMFSQPQGAAGGGIVAFQAGGRGVDRRILDSLTLRELQEYNRTGKLPGRFEIMADPSVAGMTVDPIFGTSTGMPTFSGMLEQQGGLMTPSTAEDVIARAQRGEGPNVSRPAAPADIAVVPPGGPVIPRPTGIAEAAPAKSVVKKPEEKKPLSIFDEAKNAADKLNAYKTQFGIGGEDPDAAMREKLKQLQEGSKEERREAAYMAMIMAGLGIAGGTSPYFAVNLKEAIPALKEYGVAKRDIKKAEMEYTKMETELNRSAEARKRGDMELALRLQESAADRELKLRTVVAAERNANKPSQLRELIDIATGTDKARAELAQKMIAGKSGPKAMSQYERARLYQTAMKNASDEINNNRQISRLKNSKDPKDRAEAERLSNEIIAKHTPTIGGATFLGYEE